MRVVSVVGARPQFVKAAAVSKVLRSRHEEILIHTGQHFDAEMSAVFFSQLAIPDPDLNLCIGGGSPADQVGRMLSALDGVLSEVKPDWVLVYGDTNSTLAGAIAASKAKIRLAHVEAGMRCYDRRRPEEANRVLTDHVSDLLLVPSETARKNLLREGISEGVSWTGDPMLDVVLASLPASEALCQEIAVLGLGKGDFAFATVHRAETVDDRESLTQVVDGLGSLGVPVVLALHPRTRARIFEFAIRLPSEIKVVSPLGYFASLSAQRHASVVLTDSGGVQREAFFLGVPVVSLMRATEWTETVDEGRNVVSGVSAEGIRIAFAAASNLPRLDVRPTVYGDGQAASRIVEELERASAGRDSELVGAPRSVTRP